MIGLIDIDGKIPNLALMKLSSHYKYLGEEVRFIDNHEVENIKPKEFEKIYASSLFTWNKEKWEVLKDRFGDTIEIGGTGYSFEEVNGELTQVRESNLPDIIERSKPDFELYTPEILYRRTKGIAKKESKLKKATELANMGIGFTSRGCPNVCSFCIVSQKEGCLKFESEIKDIINPKSNILTLLDNNFTADPYCIDKLIEIKERKLTLDLTQGIDIRRLDDFKAHMLSEVKHLRSLHYA